MLAVIAVFLVSCNSDEDDSASSNNNGGSNNVGGNNQVVTEHTCGTPDVHNPTISYGTMVDQEGNTYRTVNIGEQEWMAENLNSSLFQNGDSIQTNLTHEQWFLSSEGQTASWKYNNVNFESPACPYGKYYNWYAIADPRGVCPSGWHIPTYEDWSELVHYLDENAGDLNSSDLNTAGSKLKGTVIADQSQENYTHGIGQWIYSPQSLPTNSSGFSALPGSYYKELNYFYGEGVWAMWWIVNPDFTSETNAPSIYVTHLADDVSLGLNDKEEGLNVRCVRD